MSSRSERVSEELSRRLVSVQLRVAAWLDGADVERRRYSDAELDEAERVRGVRLPAELRVLYRVIGSGPFAFFEIEPPDDPWGIAQSIRDLIELERSENVYDSPGSGLVEGASPSAAALSFAGADPCTFLYDTAAGTTRIVVFEGGVGYVRRSATVAGSLVSFLECVAALCEGGALKILEGSDGPPWVVSVDEIWDPAPYRHILDQHGVTGAIMLSPHLD